MPAPQGFGPEVPAATRLRVVLVLAAAVVAFSASGTLVRGMEGIGPVALAAWRCLGAAILLAPGVWRGLPALSRGDAVRIGVAGALLGAHFAVWFASLSHTTVMRATLFVALTPVSTGLLEWALRGDRPSPRFWAGLGVALAGVAWLTGAPGDGTLWGDGLALLGSLLWTLYFLIGRDVRARVEVTAWMGLVSGAAALCLLPVALVAQQPLTGFPTTTWLLVLAAVLGPQLTGHQGAAYAVRYLPARTVSAVLLLEPVGATFVAWWALGEVPPPGAATAGLVVVAGVALATWAVPEPAGDQPG